MASNDPAKAQRLARGLGWASLGLGLWQVRAPDVVARVAGVDDSSHARPVIQLVGVRELVHAGGLLAARDPAPWVWTRVAGDAMDLVALGRALAGRRGTRRSRAALATATVGAVSAVDTYAAVLAARAGQHHRDDPWRDVHGVITVNRPREEVYQRWHDFENLPTFMTHVRSVRATGPARLHWVANAPAGRTLEWDAEIVEDRPEEVIRWRSLEGSSIANSGSVRFSPAPGERGTEVRVELRYAVAAPAVSLTLAELFGEAPRQQVDDELRRFKQVLETGEVVRSEASPEGPMAHRLAFQRPAQPLPAS
jgi:uncharacterized membrane protein